MGPTADDFRADSTNYLRRLLELAGYVTPEDPSSSLASAVVRFKHDHGFGAGGPVTGEMWRALAEVAQQADMPAVQIDWARYPAVREAATVRDIDDYLRSLDVDPRELRSKTDQLDL